MNELEIIQHPQIDGLNIFFDTLDYRTSHLHLEWELMWILDNELSVMCGQQQFQVLPQQMIIFGPNEPHEFRKVDHGVTFLCFQISPQILPVMPLLELDGRMPHLYLNDSEMKDLKQTLWRMANAYFHRDHNYALLCTGSCCMILYELLQRLPVHILSEEEVASHDKRNARLKRLIRFVDENYMHKIRLTDFAKMENCSLNYISHFIKETMNQSFQEYVAAVRFNCACKLIANGNMQMLDVCMESGFSDYRYFSREFRRHYNMTPEQYSHYKRKVPQNPNVFHHSIHSTERFYSRDESIRFLEKELYQ